MSLAPTRINLWHGYTLTDIDRLAGTATRIAFARTTDHTDRYDAAWHAIAETLATSGHQQPRPSHLIQAGTHAIADLTNKHRSTHGITRDSEPAPRYLRYWELERRTTPSAEDRVVDRTALAQIWPHLSHRHQTTLLAHSLHDDREAAAATLGVSTKTFNAYLSQARKAFLLLWHEHETPSKPWARSYSHRGPATVSEMLRTRRRLASARTAGAAA